MNRQDRDSTLLYNSEDGRVDHHPGISLHAGVYKGKEFISLHGYDYPTPRVRYQVISISPEDVEGLIKALQTWKEGDEEEDTP